MTFVAGTSIGFKNIASKIAYDLRLWLNRLATPNNANNIGNSSAITTSKITQTSPTNEKQSMSSIDNEKAPPPDDIWSFDSGDDVIEISLSECTTPAKDAKVLHQAQK